MKKTRHLIQLAFLLLVVIAVFVVKGNAERWCPFGGVEAIYTYINEGTTPCSLGISNFYILAAVLTATLLLRRAFCSFVCPIGTICEWLRLLGGKIGIRAIAVPYWAERLLAPSKYLVLTAILWLTYRSGELMFRGFDPCYALLSRHGEDITCWAYIVAAVIVLGSLFMAIPFCRWFCPLAAVLNPFSRFGFTRIKRDQKECINCGKCAQVCPMQIPVDQVDQVTAARCISCLNCLEHCPKSEAIYWGPPPWLGRSWSGGVLVALLVLLLATAAVTEALLPLPSFVKSQGQAPPQIAVLELRLEHLSCRGRANLLVYFLQRDDMYALSGYWRLEAWPGPGIAPIRISYDPKAIDAVAIKEAIAEPYFDNHANLWRQSPFRIEGQEMPAPPK